MDERPRLLLIDDGETYAEAIPRHISELVLIHPGIVEQPRLPDGPCALAWLAKRAEEVDVVLLDMHFDLPEAQLLPLPEAQSLRRQRRYQGIAILRAIRGRHPDLPVVLLTSVRDLALGDIAQALSAQSLTYLLDGEDLDALRIRIHTALVEGRRDPEEDGIFWGRDQGVRALRRRLSVLARGRLPVILEGETGTGKSYLAERALHERSGRSGAFVVLDLSTIPRDLIPAHLFGSVRGAYTGAISDRKGVFELAHQGSLFIDEIQNVPLEVQKQLLLVLQDRKLRPLGSTRELAVDVKIIAASNQPLMEAVRAGRFRADLYMRLSPATRILLPPLRARPSDLPFLATRFLDKACQDPDVAALLGKICHAEGLGAKAPLRLLLGHDDGGEGLRLVLPEPAWRRMARHPWPGNLRELSMVMHNIVTFTLVAAMDAIEMGARLRSGRLQVDPALIEELLAGSILTEEPIDPQNISVKVEAAKTLNQVSTSVERQYFLELFRRTQGDFGLMAEQMLGDPTRGRAVRLRFNQLGLKVRSLRGLR